jgi:hypothetical protein
MTKPVVEIENLDIEKELACKCCGMYNYDTEFLIRWQAFRYVYGKPLTITSGGRCVQHNKNVGGKPNSCHICEGKKASATDVTCNDLSRLYNSARYSGLFNEVIWYRNMGFIHLGLDRNKTSGYYAII